MVAMEDGSPGVAFIAASCGLPGSPMATRIKSLTLRGRSRMGVLSAPPSVISMRRELRSLGRAVLLSVQKSRLQRSFFAPVGRKKKSGLRPAAAAIKDEKNGNHNSKKEEDWPASQGSQKRHPGLRKTYKRRISHNKGKSRQSWDKSRNISPAVGPSESASRPVVNRR